MIENSSAGHLLYTNRWNLHKAPRLKGEPLSPFTQVGIYFTTSVEPALSGWWRARAGPNFGPNFRTKTIFEPKRREIPKTYMTTWLPLLLRSHLIWSCHRQDLKSRPLVRCCDLCNTSPHNRWPTKEKNPSAKQSWTLLSNVKSIFDIIVDDARSLLMSLTSMVDE